MTDSSTERTPQYEVTHCHNNPEIAYVKRSPHKCVGYGEYKCVGVQDEIAMISLPRQEPEMVEIVRRSNVHEELVAFIEAYLEYTNTPLWQVLKPVTREQLQEMAYATLAKARGES